MTSTLAFAFAAGMASTVNPCGFAMVPAFLAYYVGGDSSTADITTTQRLTRALAVAAAVTVGFAVVFITAGLLTAVGLRAIIAVLPRLAAGIGVALIIIGLAVITGRSPRLPLNANRLLRPGAGPRAMLSFGAAYATASLSCTLAVLLALATQAAATRNPLMLIAVFVAYSVGAGVVIVLLAVSAAFASGAVSNHLRRLLPYMHRLAGGVLALVGVYLLAYWGPAWRDGSPSNSVGRFGARASAPVAQLLDRNRTAVVVVVAVVALLAAAVRMTAGRFRPSGVDAVPECCGPFTVERSTGGPQ